MDKKQHLNIKDFFSLADTLIPKLKKELESNNITSRITAASSKEGSENDECSKLNYASTISLQQWRRLSNIGEECLLAYEKKATDLVKQRQLLEEDLQQSDIILSQYMQDYEILEKKIDYLEALIRKMPSLTSLQMNAEEYY